jgi:hypothetical protein
MQHLSVWCHILETTLRHSDGHITHMQYMAMPNRFEICLALYKHYIDDVISIWLLTDPNKWSDFKTWYSSFDTLP